MNGFKNVSFLAYRKQDRKFTGSNAYNRQGKKKLGQEAGLFGQAYPSIEFDRQPLELSLNRSWVKVTSVVALAGYIGQLACQFLILSGLWLVQGSPAKAMEKEEKLKKESHQPLVNRDNPQDRSGRDLDARIETVLFPEGGPTLEDIKQESIKIIQRKIGPREISGWVLQDVEDNGNCFYDAVAHQMRKVGHSFLKTVPEGTLPRNALRLLIQGKDFKDKQWAEDQHFDELVKKVNVILAIVDTRNPEAGYVYYYLGKDGEIVTRAPDADIPLPNDRPTIKLAATGNHFLSVVSEASENLYQVGINSQAGANSQEKITISISQGCETNKPSNKPQEISPISIEHPTHQEANQPLANELFDQEREELIERILEATHAEFSAIAVARRNPQLQAIHNLLVEPEMLLIEGEKVNFLMASSRTANHPFLGGIMARGEKLAADSLCPSDVLKQYRNYRKHCVILQGDGLAQHITPKAILYIDDQHIYRIAKSLAYKINSINEYNLSQRENDTGNHAVCQLGEPGRSVHFKNNNCHTDLSPAMESAMYGFYSLVAPNSVTPSFFMRIERLPIKKPNKSELMVEWNAVERGDKALTTFINDHADKQADLFTLEPQNFVLQGSRTAEGMRFDKFLEQVKQGQASYDTINRESFSYHVLLSLLFNPSDYKADNLFLSPEGHIVGIDNDGCLAHPIIHVKNVEARQKEYHVGVKNVLYLLPLMQEAAHGDVIKTFKNLNVPLTLLRWMSFLDSQDKRHQTTFDRQGLERHIEDSHSFPVRLVSGTMVSLYEGLQNLQKILSDSWGITHQQLLMKFQPLVGEAYQAHLKVNPDPLEAMSVIYDRKADLQKLLPHLVNDLQAQAHSKDAYTLNRKVSLTQEIQAVLPKLQEDDVHLAQVLDYLVRYLPDYASYLSLIQDPKRFKRMLTAGTSIPSLRWLLANKFQNTSATLQWEPDDLVNYARTFMPQIPKNHLEGHLNPVLSLILDHFAEWADELLPRLPENAWHQVVQEQSQQQIRNDNVLNYLLKRDPEGLSRLDVSHKTPLDIALEYLKNDIVARITTDLISKGAWQMSLSGRQYRGLKKEKDQLPVSFWRAFELLQERNAKVGWTVTLEELFPIASKQGQNTVQGASGEIRLLTETLLRQLLSPHREVTHGRRKVIQVSDNGCFAFLKFYPELVGIEEAVGELTRRTIGFGAPHGELFRFPDGIPVWVSQGIPGHTLQWVLTHDPKRLTQLDPVSTTQFILMAMLVNPEDGKPDNYIVEPLPNNPNLYRLSCPDNDHGFVPAFVKTKPDKGNMFKDPELIVQVKTILYCLDQMNSPIPEETKALFLKGDPLVLMEEWLTILDRRNRRYESLYSSSEAAHLFEQRECFMGIPFQKGMISHLYSKWIRLQGCLGRKATGSRPSAGSGKSTLTPLELLAKLEPRLANRYREAFKRPQNKTVWDRFKWVDGDFYHQKGDHWTTLTLSGSILTSQNIPLQKSALENIRNGRDQGPTQAIAELKTIADQKGKTGLTVPTMATDTDREEYLKSFDFSQQAVSEQRNIVKQLIPYAANLRNLTLKNCTIIEDKLLQEKFLIGNLVYLDLNGCSSITHTILPVLSQNMPGLKILNLANLPKLRWVADPGFVTNNPVTFKQLRKLNVNNCLTLEAIVLKALSLKHFWCNGSKKLQVLLVVAPELQTLSCQEVPIEDNALHDLLAQSQNLKSVDITNCPKITQINLDAPNLKHFCFNGVKKLQVLKIKAPELQTLSCQEVPIEDKELYDFLAQSQNIKSVDITNCPKITQKAKKILPAFLDPSLTELKLSSSEVGEVEAQALANKTTLTTLDLNGNNIGDVGAQALAKNITLTLLYLMDNRIGNVGAQALANNTTLTTLGLSYNSIGNLGVQALANNTTLKILDLYKSSIESEGAQALANNTTLTTLYLRANSIGYVGTQALANNTTLITLDLSINKIGGVGAQALANNTTLTSLDLGSNNIGFEGAQALANNTTLTSLDLSENDIGNVGVQALANNTTLTSLNLSNNNVGFEGAQALANNTTLKTLSLWENNIGFEGAQALANNTTLTSLTLNGNNIGDVGAQALANNTTLEILILHGNHVESEGAQALANNTTLTSLDLSHNDIGDLGAQALAKNTTLKALDLGRNNVGDEGAQALANNTTLTSLELYSNNIGGEGAQALANNTTLTSMDLSYNDIGDVGAQALAKNTTLTGLDLGYNNIGDPGKGALRNTPNPHLRDLWKLGLW